VERPTRREGPGVVRQHGDGEPLTDEALKRLIQEAVDHAMAAIERGERDVDRIAGHVAGRLEARDPALAAQVVSMEARLGQIEGRLRSADERHGRVEGRIEELSHHVGHREALNVAAVPPTILEKAFQVALDDLCAELSKVKGRDEVERILDDALVDVRGQSKGAELFERKDQRLVIQGVGSSIARKLFSAKAAQATFDEVVKHLRIHLPHYRPRPLAALVRLRSHDFAVDAAVRHQERIKQAESQLEHLLREAERIEREAKEADRNAAQGVSQSFMQAVMERRAISEEMQGRLKSLEKRAVDAEGRLEKALSRLEAVEKYATRVEAAMIRKTKDGTYRGDFTPVIDAVQEALADGKARTVSQLAKRVKGVDREVVEAIVREALREGVLAEVKGGKVRLSP
jgi:hypothetical protein